AELLEGHRHLLVGPAQLPHPHVDRVLAALVADLALVAGALPGALVAAAGGLSGARALSPADALARPARALRRLQGVAPQVLSHSRPPPGARPHAASPAAGASPRGSRAGRSARASGSAGCLAASARRRWRSGPA